MSLFAKIPIVFLLAPSGFQFNLAPFDARSFQLTYIPDFRSRGYTFVSGKPLAYKFIGVIVILIALIAVTGQLVLGSYNQTTNEQRKKYEFKLGNKLFIPAILIPVITVLCTLLLKKVSIGGVLLLDQNHLTLAALAIACITAILGGVFVASQIQGSPFKRWCGFLLTQAIVFY